MGKRGHKQRDKFCEGKGKGAGKACTAYLCKHGDYAFFGRLERKRGRRFAAGRKHRRTDGKDFQAGAHERKHCHNVWYEQRIFGAVRDTDNRGGVCD